MFLSVSVLFLTLIWIACLSVRVKRPARQSGGSIYLSEARACSSVRFSRAPRQILDAIERLFHNECAFKPVYLFGPPELEMVHAKVIFLGVSFLPVDPEKSGYRETSEISRFFCSRLLEQTLKFKKSEHETNILLE
jgi:hypothetical protein